MIKRKIKKTIKKLIKFALLPLKIISLPILKSEWYKSLFFDADGELYPDNYWYRKHDERNYDLVNIGSSGAKWGLDYSNFNIKAMNWAQQPQTLLEDFNILRNFHSILKRNGIILIVIMPFTGLRKTTGARDAIRYLKIHSHEPIEPYGIRKARLLMQYPILFGKNAIKSGIKYLLGIDVKKTNKSNLEVNPMSAENLDKDALHWVNVWKKQFNISDFDAPLTEDNRERCDYCIKLMQTLIDFCQERSYRPVYVIPPVTQHLAKYYTPKFEETYIYGYLRSVNRNIPLLDYSKDKSLQEDDLFFNSFFLNKRGRNLFTEQLLKDVGVI